MSPGTVGTFSPYRTYGLFITTSVILIYSEFVALLDNAQYPNVILTFSDDQLYHHIVGRVSSGEGYYKAATSELVVHGYPTGSVFNWRTPVYAWLLGSLPRADWAWPLLVAMLVWTAISLTDKILDNEKGFLMKILVSGHLLGSYALCRLPQSVYVHEIWSGVLILISIYLYSINQWFFAALSGLLSLFIRELALPYCFVCLCLSCADRRTKECISWLLGLVAFAGFMLCHYANVRRNVNGVSTSVADWIQFNGLSFILGTCRTNRLVAYLPSWCVSLYLTLSLFGLLGWQWRESTRIRLVVGVYLLVFAIAGKQCNHYWGWIYSPLLTIGSSLSPLVALNLYKCSHKFKSQQR